MESLANNHPFLDGNKRIAFAGLHTFLLVNGYDLEVRPLAAYEFMMHSIARGEFRFGPILEWINNHIRRDSWRDRRMEDYSPWADLRRVTRYENPATGTRAAGDTDASAHVLQKNLYFWRKH